MANFELSNEKDMPVAEHLELRITKLAEGLGYGSGTISGSGEGIEADVLARVDDAIEHGTDLLVAVDRDDDGDLLTDDGCGDGRAVEQIFRGTEPLKRSLNRAKVFGGGLTMSVATRIGLGEAGEKPLSDLFVDSIHDLADKRIDFGAHTDSHAAGDPHSQGCGCGAIDKAPAVISNIVSFEPQIRNTLHAFAITDAEMDEAFVNFRMYAQQNADKSFNGRDVMNSITEHGKVVKQLAGGHKEMRIILNDVEGHTVNQQQIRDVSGDESQVFATDLWRLRQLAEALYPDNAEQQRDAYISELIYTLGVAATLTSGDLPTYLVSAEPALVAA